MIYMPLKRASRGRRKGGKGSSGTVQCTNCGQTVPKDKAKKITSRLNLVEHSLAKELRAQGARASALRDLPLPAERARRDAAADRGQQRRRRLGLSVAAGR